VRCYEKAEQFYISGKILLEHLTADPLIEGTIMNFMSAQKISQ